MNKISDDMKELVESVIYMARLAQHHDSGYAVINEAQKQRATLLERIATLEADNARLQAELDRRKWKKGHPKHKKQVLVKLQYPNGEVRFDVNQYSTVNGDWLFHYSTIDPEVLAWCGIEPWEGE